MVTVLIGILLSPEMIAETAMDIEEEEEERDDVPDLHHTTAQDRPAMRPTLILPAETTVRANVKTGIQDETHDAKIEAGSATEAIVEEIGIATGGQ